MQMHTNHRWLCLLGFSAMTACSQNQPTLTTSTDITPELICADPIVKYLEPSQLLNRQSCSKSPIAHPEIQWFQGIIKRNQEQIEFTRCDDTETLPLKLDDADLEEISPMLAQAEQGLYAAFYALPAENADSPIAVKHLNLASVEMNGCERDLPKRIAFGTEPFWSANLEGNTLEFRQFGLQNASFIATDLYYDGQYMQLNGDRFSLRLSRTQCQDQMSDTLYGWQAELGIDDQIFTGCGQLPSMNAKP